MRRLLALTTLAASVGAVSHSANAVCTLTYGGGPVISNIQAVAVFWGSSPDAQVASTMPGYLTALVDSEFVDILGQYSTVGLTSGSNQRIGRGTFAGSYTITPAASAQSLNDSDVASELAAQISAHHLPAPTLDGAGLPETVYFIFFPPGVTITDPAGNRSCQVFCSYHNAVVVNGMTLQYGILPDQSPSSPCFGSCGASSSYIEDLESNVSHQLSEAITDATPGTGWYNNSNSCGEIGDICQASQATLVGTSYVVQKIWSNASGACIAQPGCSPTCAAPTPVCDTFQSHANTCVACFTDPDCPKVECQVVTCAAATEQCAETPSPDGSPCDAGACLGGACRAPDAGGMPDAGMATPDGGVDGGAPDAGLSIHSSGCETGGGPTGLLVFGLGLAVLGTLGNRTPKYARRIGRLHR